MAADPSTRADVVPDYLFALAAQEVAEVMAGFDPQVVGTPPLGLDPPGSGIDIVCQAPDPAAFA